MITSAAAAGVFVVGAVLGLAFGLWLGHVTWGHSTPVVGEPEPEVLDPDEVDAAWRDSLPAVVDELAPEAPRWTPSPRFPNAPTPPVLVVDELEHLAPRFGVPRYGGTFDPGDYLDPPRCVRDHELSQGVQFWEISLPDQGEGAVLTVCGEHAPFPTDTTPEVHDEGPAND